MARKKRENNLKQRLITSTIALPITLVLVLLSNVPLFRSLFVLAIAAVAALAVGEFYLLAQKKRTKPLAALGIATTLCYLFATYISSGPLSVAVMTLSLIIAFTLCFSRNDAPIATMATTYFGLLYITIPLAFLVNIAYFFPEESSDQGRWWLLYLLVVAKMSDTGAYFAGKAWGRRKLAPMISPNKTWEGAIAGCATAIGASFIFSMASPLFAFSLAPIDALILGLILALLAQFGDLTESLLKRDAGVKDSSQLPGLGGFLDLIDSLIFTGPALYFYLKVGV